MHLVMRLLVVTRPTAGYAVCLYFAITGSARLHNKAANGAKSAPLLHNEQPGKCADNASRPLVVHKQASCTHCSTLQDYCTVPVMPACVVMRQQRKGMLTRKQCTAPRRRQQEQQQGTLTSQHASSYDDVASKHTHCTAL
jgi:hypothetical protein